MIFKGNLPGEYSECFFLLQIWISSKQIRFIQSIRSSLVIHSNKNRNKIDSGMIPKTIVNMIMIEITFATHPQVMMWSKYVFNLILSPFSRALLWFTHNYTRHWIQIEQKGISYLSLHVNTNRVQNRDHILLHFTMQRGTWKENLGILKNGFKFFNLTTFRIIHVSLSMDTEWRNYWLLLSGWHIIW